jgi:hypothetical protein
MTVTHEAAIDQAPVAEPKKAKTRKAKQSTPEQPASEIAVEPAPTPETLEPETTTPATEPERKPRARKEKQEAKPKESKPAKRKGPMRSVTLKQLADRYAAHLTESGKSPGTSFSYGMELKTACRFLGEDTLISSISADDVHRFFNAREVVMLKTGRPKAQPSIDKTRRVLRLALVWAAEEGLIAEAPIPSAPSTEVAAK